MLAGGETGDKFPINAQYIFFVLMLGTIWSYMVVSMGMRGLTYGAGSVVGGYALFWAVRVLTGHSWSFDDLAMLDVHFWSFVVSTGVLTFVAYKFYRGNAINMDRMFYRGTYAREEKDGSQPMPTTGLGVFKMGREFTLGDKCIFVGSYAYIFVFFGVFLAGTLYALRYDIADASWMQFWRVYCWVMLALSIVVGGWITVGGLFDLKELSRLLRTAKRDDRDDGSVLGHRNLHDAE
jgi:hypothetical protein